MRVSVYLPFAMSLVLAAGGPILSRWLAPRTAARVLTAGAAVTTASALWALGLLVLSLLVERGQPVLSADVPRLLGLLAIVLAVAVLVRVALVARAHSAALRFAREFARAHPAGDGGLVVLADGLPFAATLPGPEGRIVISSAMLASLGPRERRVLLCHERSHLRHRHDRYQLAGELASAGNPLLGAVRRSITHALERWADEDAAAAIGSRPLVARTLVSAALAPPPATAGALGFSADGVAARVHALYGSPTHTRLSAVALVLAVAGLAALASADATVAIERLLHLVTIGSV